MSCWLHLKPHMQPCSIENLPWRLLQGCLEQNTIGIATSVFKQMKAELLCSESHLSSYNHWSIQNLWWHIVASTVQNTSEFEICNLRYFFSLHHSRMSPWKMAYFQEFLLGLKNTVDNIWRSNKLKAEVESVHIWEFAALKAVITENLYSDNMQGE